MVHLRELNRDDASCSSSYFQKTVMLRDWWLIKCSDEFEGKRFGVAGTELMASVERRAVRVFTSAPIVKALDVWTLETSDGICILLKGLINKERTVKGGFSPEIFRHFIFGFPPRWEEISNNYFKGETSCGAGIDSVPPRIDSADHPILTPCENKDNTQESKNKNIIDEINTAEASDEGDSNEDSGSPVFNMAMPRENSGVKSRKTQTRSTKQPVISEEVKVEQNAARKSLRLQLKAGGNSTENKSKSDTAELLNLSDGVDHSGSLRMPVTESNGSLNEAKTVDAEKDDRYGIVDDVISPEVDTTVPGEPSASQVDEFAKSHTGPASKEKVTRKCATKKSASLEQHKVKQKATRASPRLLSKEYEKKTKSGKSQHSSKMAKSVKSEGKVKPLNHCERQVEEDKNCVQEENLTGARTKRKINFDVEATPGKQARKPNTALVSPESLSIKRSRSGRLLVSSLEFWRNQIPVYDAERKIIGIKEGVDATTPDKGKGSESERRRR